MAKGKLKIENSEQAALKLAAELQDVEIEQGKTIGNKTIVEVSYRKPDQLFEMGRSIETIKKSESK